MPRLIIVTRRDLAVAVQATQALHAAVQFGIEQPEITEEWSKSSNTVVIVAAADESELVELVVRAADAGLATSEFLEPALDNHCTAVALEPSEEAERLVRRLPLAFGA